MNFSYKKYTWVKDCDNIYNHSQLKVPKMCVLIYWSSVKHHMNTMPTRCYANFIIKKYEWEWV